MTDARSLHCKEEGVVGKSDVGEGKITSARVLGTLGGSIQLSSSLRSISPNKRIHVSDLRARESCCWFKRRGGLKSKRRWGWYSVPI